MLFNRTLLMGPLRDEKDGMITGVGKKAQEKLKEDTKNLTNLFKSYNKELVNALGPLEKHIDLANQMREANEAMLKAGGDFYSKFSSGGEFSRALDRATQFSSDFFGSAERGAKALVDLSTNMNSFLGMTESGQVGLAKSTTLMKELGFEAAALAKAMDNQAMAFGATEKQLQTFAGMMSKISNDLFVNPRKLMENFTIAQTNFGYSSEKTLDVFARMQVQSRKTGLEFSTMADKFGQGLDTFGGATDMAGKLNQVLGANVFNPLELLGMDEATRAATIQSRLQQRLDMDALGKFEIKAIGAALGGLSPVDVRKFLSEGPEEGMKALLGQQIDDRAVGLEGMMTQLDQEGMQAFSENTNLATNELIRMKETIVNLRTPLENMAISLSKSAQVLGDEMMIEFGAALGVPEEALRGNRQRMVDIVLARLTGAVEFDESLTDPNAAAAMVRERTKMDATRRPGGLAAMIDQASQQSPVYGGSVAGGILSTLETIGLGPKSNPAGFVMLLPFLNASLAEPIPDDPATPDVNEFQPARILRNQPAPGASRSAQAMAGASMAGDIAGEVGKEAKEAAEALGRYSKDPTQANRDAATREALEVFMTQQNAEKFSKFLSQFIGMVLQNGP